MSDKDTDDSENPVSVTKLVIAMVVMLNPAAVPLYFALGAEGTTLALLIGAACAVAVVNLGLVYAIWNWVNTAASETDSTS